MTKKRFTTNGYKIYDTFHDGIHWLVNQVEANEIVDKMNNLDSKARERSKALSKLQKENEQLKQQLKGIEDSFKFSCTENYIEFNKDKLKVEDTHTKITLKDGKLCISVFIPQLNEYVKFFYLVTGRKMGREFINYDGDVE